MKKKAEIVITRVKEMPKEEQRAEIVRLRSMCLEEIASAQRVIDEYAAKANKCTQMLQEMDGKVVKKYESQKHPYSAFDDGDDWD